MPKGRSIHTRPTHISWRILPFAGTPIADPGNRNQHWPKLAPAKPVSGASWAIRVR